MSHPSFDSVLLTRLIPAQLLSLNSSSAPGLGGWRHTALAAACLLSIASHGVLANEVAASTKATPESALRGEPGEAGINVLDSVVVLGSVRGDATVLTSSAPVDVFSSQQIAETGAVSINQALAKLHPSFNFPQGQNAVKGQGVRSASLRGVSPAYTLVLVNGKRRNASAQLTGTDPWPAATVVDLNVIPVSAVQRIEVLRDGAAAQYGSDAIAGVVNIVLRDSDTGGKLSLHGGGYSDGGGRTVTATAWKGLPLGSDGFLNFSLDRLQNNQVDRSEADWRQLFPNGDPRNSSFDKKYGIWGQSSRDQWSGLINAELALAPHWAAYGWVNYASKTAGNYVNPERVVKASTTSVTATAGDKISENAVLSVYPNGYQPKIDYTAKDLAAVIGVRLEEGAFGKLDLGLSHGSNETSRRSSNTINPSYGANSPTSFYLGSWKSDTQSLTADYQREIKLESLDKPLGLQAGLLARKETWRTGDLGDAIGYTAGPLAGKTVGSLYPGTAFASDSSRIPVSGASTSGIRPEDANSITRQVRGGYASVDANLTANWQLGLAGRFEHYSDFGNTNTFKLDSRYDFGETIALRGTVSSGFHAPSLAALGTQTTGVTGSFSNNGIGILAPGGTRLFRPNDPAAAAFGALPLEPERSRTYSVGTVLRPAKNSSLTLDFYRLEVKDVIITTDTIQGPAAVAAFNAAGLPGYVSASYYYNGWTSRTYGLDLVGRSRIDVAGGSLDLSAALSLLDTKISDVKSSVNVRGTAATVVGPSRIRDAETGVPKNKLVLGARYALGDWTTDATLTRFGKYRYNAGNVPGAAAVNGNIDQDFKAETYLDLAAFYAVNKQLKLDIGVQNVFNSYPEKYVNGNRASGVNPYSFIAPNGASGRFVSVGLSYSL
ncbi:TonB-dependent receptor plug domain-containing protein [Paucibacter sp. Y2R2-4]|uniref:TonB-dependent receptor plug domain-containing protein n=1 Tax=Paucibacter sp. Y2R2-4 TaxID=2893553 RepID=UPI0021E41713|nr:TonB-dependent receptor [Paucibacter sp. Y2R2-4]MCV2348307.1 TonB-dependent receptor [Paucibacter sp. Y2R2-4]